MNVIKYLLILLPFSTCVAQQTKPGSARYITVSNKNPNYFSFTDGTAYIPVGINMINPSGRYGNNPDSAFYEIEQWMKNLAANGGNYVRIWLSQSFWDVEEDEAGRYDEKKAARIDRFIEMARKYHLRIKMTLEHFRSITLEENPQKWATRYAYHRSKGGPLDSVEEYLSTDKGRKLFLDKLGYYKKRYGSDTLFFGWELWNEMNAMRVPRDSVFYDWNTKMLAELKKTFPENLAMQSLGSFDAQSIRPLYRKIMEMAGNEVAQVHRYLDLGAEMEVCHAPMDVICASAVKELQSYNLNKPIILAETGAVEPRHAGPSKYYPKDTSGILLHDILFAPFFTGSAGPGMSWHWESYVHKNNLWHHYGRFNEAIKGIDPIRESFMPSFKETSSLRVYILKGKRTTLIWLRDKLSNWQTELEKGSPARTIDNEQLKISDLGITKKQRIRVYDPWRNIWLPQSDASALNLKGVKRSAVIRLEDKSPN